MQTISDDTPVAMLTAGQLRDFLGLSEPRKPQQENSTPPTPKRLVYGLAGIRELFNVSHATAQRYKNTILTGAISQQGRKIVVDADEALRLFSEHQKCSTL